MIYLAKRLAVVVMIAGSALMSGEVGAAVISRDQVLGTTEPTTGQGVEDQTARLGFLIDQYNLGNAGILSPAGEIPHVYHLDAGSMVPAPMLAANPVLVATGTGYQGGPAALNQGALVKTSGPRRIVAPPPHSTVGPGTVVTHLAFMLDLGAGYDYLLVQWEAADAFYYVGGLTGAVGVSNDVSPNPDCRPHGALPYMLFSAVPPGNSPVPETGTTGGLLVLALSGVAVLKFARIRSTSPLSARH